VDQRSWFCRKYLSMKEKMHVIDPALEQIARPASLEGCPMFAPAYMGRKRRGAALSTLLLRGQKDYDEEQE